VSLTIPHGIIAHRGASAEAPENTLAAFQLAHDIGAAWVEFDVMLSKDGVPVVIHDLDLERTTNGHGRVADYTLEELQRLDAGKGEKIPTLAQTLELLQTLGLGANLEIKPNLNQEVETAEAVLVEVNKRWKQSPDLLLLSSFALDSLRRVQQLDPHWSRGLLLESWSEPWQSLAEIYAVDTVNGPGDVQHSQVKAVKQAGYDVLVYTIDDPTRAKECWEWGVTAVFTNHPRLLLTV
jgi:glycerophosphoryl diester phosphodiesterase